MIAVGRDDVAVAKRVSGKHEAIMQARRSLRRAADAGALTDAEYARASCALMQAQDRAKQESGL